MTRAEQKLVTAEELLRMVDLGPCELVEGGILTMTPAGFRHGVIGSRIVHRIASHVVANELGVVVGEQTGFLLSRDPDTVRAPDAAFVRAERAEEVPEGYFPGAPDLVVEVVSPDDRAGEVHAKARMWIEAGARLVWVVWPSTKTVTVYRPGGEPATLRQGDSLNGEDVLPGFQCAVGDIFA